VHGLADLLHRGGSLVGTDPAGGHASLEELDLEDQVGVSLGEEPEGLLGRGVRHLADVPLAVGGGDVDGAVLGDAAPLPGGDLLGGRSSG
jgi:hypothetical protein